MHFFSYNCEMSLGVSVLAKEEVIKDNEQIRS